MKLKNNRNFLKEILYFEALFKLNKTFINLSFTQPFHPAYCIVLKNQSKLSTLRIKTRQIKAFSERQTLENSILESLLLSIYVFQYLFKLSLLKGFEKI